MANKRKRSMITDIDPTVNPEMDNIKTDIDSIENIEPILNEEPTIIEETPQIIEETPIIAAPENLTQFFTDEQLDNLIAMAEKKEPEPTLPVIKEDKVEERVLPIESNIKPKKKNHQIKHHDKKPSSNNNVKKFHRNHRRGNSLTFNKISSYSAGYDCYPRAVMPDYFIDESKVIDDYK